MSRCAMPLLTIDMNRAAAGLLRPGQNRKFGRRRYERRSACQVPEHSPPDQEPLP